MRTSTASQSFTGSSGSRRMGGRAWCAAGRIFVLPSPVSLSPFILSCIAVPHLLPPPPPLFRISPSCSSSLLLFPARPSPFRSGSLPLAALTCFCEGCFRSLRRAEEQRCVSRAVCCGSAAVNARHVS
eukprot:755533-Hanusia_phi.AAC.2